MCERMKITEVEELTGLHRVTLYALMETGQADLGAVIRGEERNTYVFFRPKVERFIRGEQDRCEELIAATNKMSQLLIMAIHQAGGDVELREWAACTN